MQAAGDEIRLAHLLRGGLAGLGLDVRRHRHHPYRPAELAKEPRTILDVSAANGTPQLYGAYPDALIVAFEPLAEQLERLRLTLKGRPSDLVPVAIGDSTDEAAFN